MKLVLTVISLLLFSITVFGQKSSNDTAANKDPIAVAEFGGAISQDINGGKPSLGYNVSVEVTPIEDWLEIELGVSPTFAAHVKETDIDLLFKKPWTLSSKLEFMFGLGPTWNHTNDHNEITTAVGGETALDFMFWPFEKHKFGLYLEPAYEYDFAHTHEQSWGVSTGLLVAIP